MIGEQGGDRWRDTERQAERQTRGGSCSGGRESQRMNPGQQMEGERLTFEREKPRI